MLARTRRIGPILITIIALGLSGISAQAAKPSKPLKPAKAVKITTREVKVLPATALALPSGCKVKVRWVCPPLDTKAVEKSNWYDICFAVDSAGCPWFGAGSNIVISPTKQYRFTFPQIYNSLACMENGAFLVATDSDLGFVTPPESPKTDYNGIPIALFQPIAGLPIPECKLFSGAGNCLYLMGRNPATEQYEVYLLRPEKLATKAAVREYVKVFSSKQEIAAVAGDGNTTYVAIGRVVLKIAGSNYAKVRVSTETIDGLAYSPAVGLFIATYRGIEYMGTNGTMLLLAADQPEICLRKGSLYVLFPKSLGVAALDNVADLKRFNLAVKDVPATKSDEVKVTDVRFFEAGETAPDYGDRQYATKFDKASARYIYCQVDLTNLLKGKRKHSQVVTLELCPPGETSGESQEVHFDLAMDTPGLAGWARFGDVNPGSFYPGAYTLKTYLNGSKVDERHFTVEGEASVVEAAWFKDTARLWKLLDAGADPNQKAQDGRTPLMIAVSNASMEQVRLLLEHKADVNAKNGDGETALLIASDWYQDNSAMVRLLLENGADPNIADKDGLTPLHKAADRNSMETMRLLLEHGANPNARDNDQNTPLLKMTFGLEGTQFQAKPEQVELLLSHGGDVNAANKDGSTALYEAVEGHDPWIVRTLIKHGADVNVIRKHSDGTSYSTLWNALLSCDMGSDRLDKEKSREIVGMLCDAGANMLGVEEKNVAATGLINVLGRKKIVSILEQNNDAVWSYYPDDPWMRKYLLGRIMSLAYGDVRYAANVSWYSSALQVCLTAVERVEKWNMGAQVPEIYYDCGIIALRTGDQASAGKYLRKYLDLAPNSSEAEKARSMVANL